MSPSSSSLINWMHCKFSREYTYTNVLGLAYARDISAVNPTFRNAVLSVGVGLSTNEVAQIKALISDDFPISETTSIGALLLALAAAIVALKRRVNDYFVHVTVSNDKQSAEDPSGSVTLQPWKIEYNHGTINIKLNDAAFTSMTLDDNEQRAFLLPVDSRYTGSRDITITSCLHGDTEVEMADGTFRKIRDIGPGDCVLSLNEQGECVPSRVSELKRTFGVETCDAWTFRDEQGEMLVTTVMRHRFYKVEQWAYVYMDEWELGEHVWQKDGRVLELVKHEVLQGPVTAYGITTDRENYFVNGGLLTGSRRALPIPLGEERLRQIRGTTPTLTRTVC